MRDSRGLSTSILCSDMKLIGRIDACRRPCKPLYIRTSHRLTLPPPPFFAPITEIPPHPSQPPTSPPPPLRFSASPPPLLPLSPFPFSSNPLCLLPRLRNNIVQKVLGEPGQLLKRRPEPPAPAVIRVLHHLRLTPVARVLAPEHELGARSLL